MKHIHTLFLSRKALCLAAAAALLLGLVFAPPGEPPAPGALAASGAAQARSTQCGLLPREAEAFPLALALSQGSRALKEPWDPAPCALPPGLPPQFPRSAQGLRFSLYRPVFQRHVLVRVGTHAPPALREASPTEKKELT